MSKGLNVIEYDNVSLLQKELFLEKLADAIENYKNNMFAINAMVFVATDIFLLEGNSFEKNLDIASWQGFISDISGGNEVLLRELSENEQNLKFIAQCFLDKIPEEKLVTFELATAVINKLEMYDGEYNKDYYSSLLRHFKNIRSELVRNESKLDKIKHNEKIMLWVNSIEYQAFEGTEYTDLNDIEKIVMLVKDFSEISQGDWSISDLLSIKTAMININLMPKDKFNYLEVLKNIANDNKLKKVLVSKNVDDGRPGDFAQSMNAISYLIKNNAFKTKEAYIIDTISEILGIKNDNIAGKMIIDDLVYQYALNKLHINYNNEIEAFDLVVDLLYNLAQYNK